MKQTLHEIFHYIGRDLHFRNAVIIECIVVMIGVILGMIIAGVILFFANKPSHHDKYSGSLDDLVDSVNGVPRWRRKKEFKK